MELGTIIIGLIIIALCAAPFIFMARGRKRKQKELLKKDGSTEKKDLGDKEANKKIASPQSEDKK